MRRVHTQKLNHGTLLKKYGVAVRKASTPKKRTPGLSKAPTPADLRKKVAIAESKKQKKSGNYYRRASFTGVGVRQRQPTVGYKKSRRKTAIDTVAETHEKPREGRTETKREGRTETERATLEQSAGEQNEEASTLATGKGSGKAIKKTGTEAKIVKVDGIPEVTERTVPAAGGKKKRAAKQLLVLYSSQDSESDTTLRKSSRKRTAVRKMGGVMIDHISRGGVQKKEMSERGE